MRCPACGFVGFDSLSACKGCGRELPRQGRSVGIVPMPRREGGTPPSTGRGAAPGLPLRDVGEITDPDPPDGTASRLPPTDPAWLRQAGFWLRSLAFLVDASLVVLLASAGAMLVELAVRIGGLFSSATEAGLQWLEATATALFVVLIVLCYFTLFVGFRGQTPGKMLLRLKIVRTNGEDVGYGRALVRWAGQCIGFPALGVGFLMIASSRRKQGLHDKLAGTCVVRLLS